MSVVRKTGYWLFFFLMNLTVHDFGKEIPFFEYLSLAIPIDWETGKLKMSTYLLSVAISMFFLSMIVKEVRNGLLLRDYIFTRSNRIKGVIFLFGKTIKEIYFLMLIKFMADIFFFDICGTENMEKFLLIVISSLFTIIFWCFVVYILFSCSMKQDMIFFLCILCVVIAQYFVVQSQWFVLFIFAAPILFEQPFFWIFIKGVVSLLLGGIVLIRYWEVDCLKIKV